MCTWLFWFKNNTYVVYKPDIFMSRYIKWGTTLTQLSQYLLRVFQNSHIYTYNKTNEAMFVHDKFFENLSSSVDSYWCSN